MQPKKVEVFACPQCGKAFDSKGQAATCIRNHIEAKDMRVHSAVPDAKTDLLYEEGVRWPSTIRIFSDSASDPALYVRVGAKKPAGHASPVVLP